MVGDYFDYLDGLQFKASGVRDITGFADRGNYYLIFGMKSVASIGIKYYRFLIRRLLKLSSLKCNNYG